MTLFFSLFGCQTIGGFYTRPRAASYYVNHYCFEIPKHKAIKAIYWMLLRYNFPIQSKDLTQGTFSTKPIHMTRFNHNPKWGYLISFDIHVAESKGRLSLKNIPSWFFQKKQHKMPIPPKRKAFSSYDAYNQAIEQYQKQLHEVITAQTEGVALMKKWQGCNIQKSSLRTTININAKIIAYPLDSFGQLKRKEKGHLIRSKYRLEYYNTKPYNTHHFPLYRCNIFRCNIQ